MSKPDAFMWKAEDIVPGKKARAASRPETPIHRVADIHQPKVSVAIRYAFAMGRKALGPNANVAAATKAVRLALEDVLPPTLLKALVAGGEAAAVRLRTAGDVEGHPFHGNQWTNGGGSSATVAYHGTSGQYVQSILKDGISSNYAGQSSAISSSGVVYASSSLERAKQYAEDRRHMLGDVAVFEVHIPAEVMLQLGKTTGMGGHTIFSYAGSFKPEWIKSVRINASGSSEWKLRALAQGDGILFVPIIFPKMRAAATTIKLKFNAADPRAIKWARDHAGELAKGISDVTEERIKAAIATTLEGGSLSDAQDEIAAAVGDETRADVIARTESMMAANQGQREAWAQAADEGLLSADVQREWIATSEACPECDALDGEVVGLDEEYPNDGGDGPPLHPNCRCTEGISG